MALLSKFEEVIRDLVTVADREARIQPFEADGSTTAMRARSVKSRFDMRMRRVARKVQRDSSRVDVHFRKALRRALISEINLASLGLLKVAEAAVRPLLAIEVIVHDTSNGGAPRLEEIYRHSGDFLPGQAMEHVLRIRKYSVAKQLMAFRLDSLQAKFDENSQQLLVHQYFQRVFDFGLAGGAVRDRNDMKVARTQLPPSLAQDVFDFFETCMQLRFSCPFFLPIEIGQKATGNDLREVATAFRNFGLAFREPTIRGFIGPGRSGSAALAALERYRDVGIGLVVLSGWLLAVEAIECRRKCSICYRHASTVSRCSEHATKTGETRESRLGVRARDAYLAKRDAWSSSATFRAALSPYSIWLPEANPAMTAAAESMNLSTRSRIRAIELAQHLKRLVGLMDETMTDQVGNLFASMLQFVVSIERSDGGARHAPASSQRSKDVSEELLSLRGFLKALCGVGRYSPEVDLQMLGYDRDHPVTKGASVEISDVAVLLVDRRAWQESVKEVERLMPSADQIRTLFARRTGESNAAASVARELGISRAMVYKTLARDGLLRQRNFFG